MLAAALNKAHLFCAAFYGANERAGDAFFREAARFFTLSVYIDVSSSGEFEVEGASHRWILNVIDVLNVDLRGEIRVTIQQGLGLIELCRVRSMYVIVASPFRSLIILSVCSESV